jgi:hypothetical protein
MKLSDVYDEYRLENALYHKSDATETSLVTMHEAAPPIGAPFAGTPSDDFSNDYSLLMPLTKFRQVSAG